MLLRWLRFKKKVQAKDIYLLTRGTIWHVPSKDHLPLCSFLNIHHRKPQHRVRFSYMWRTHAECPAMRRDSAGDASPGAHCSLHEGEALQRLCPHPPWPHLYPQPHHPSAKAILHIQTVSCLHPHSIWCLRLACGHLSSQGQRSWEAEKPQHSASKAPLQDLSCSSAVKLLCKQAHFLNSLSLNKLNWVDMGKGHVVGLELVLNLRLVLN